MKTIVVLSDTHGNFKAIDKILPIINESDYLFHLGDHDSDIKAYRNDVKAKVYSVKGNCDGGGDDLTVEVEGVKILLTHGDRYGVKRSIYPLYLKAKEIGVNLVCYGHTHDASILEQDGIFLVNPGCANGFYANSYCYIVIHNGKITSKLVEF